MSPIIEPSRARLAAYLALAAGVGPAVTAEAQIVGGNLDIIGAFGAPDLGFGIGAPVEFQGAGYSNPITRYYTRFTRGGGGTSYSTQQINQFNMFGFARINPGTRWTAGSFLNGFIFRRLAQGSAVGPGAGWTGASNFRSGYFAFANFTGATLYSTHRSSFGDWLIPRDNIGLGGGALRGFLGFRVTEDGGATYDYGWFDVEYDSAAPGGLLTIHGFGFNLTPDQQILAGTLGVPAPGPGSLALLAAGAAGIRRSRRRVA